MSIERYFTGTPWEPRVGYCRALRSGSRILVSGTLGVGADAVPLAGAEAQTRAALERICAAVEALGGTRDTVVRTRLFVTDLKRDAEAVGAVHQAYFGAHPPVTTMVQIVGLMEGAVVEIEAEAEVDGDTGA